MPARGITRARIARTSSGSNSSVDAASSCGANQRMSTMSSCSLSVQSSRTMSNRVRAQQEVGRVRLVELVRRPAARALVPHGLSRATSTRRPVSSKSSRTAAACTSSPGSTPPPGCQPPLGKDRGATSGSSSAGSRLLHQDHQDAARYAEDSSSPADPSRPADDRTCPSSEQPALCRATERSRLPRLPQSKPPWVATSAAMSPCEQSG